MTENPSWREAMRGERDKPAAAPRPGETPEQVSATEQTQLLRKIAADVSTMRNIAVFFTFLWGLGVVVFLLTLLSS